MDRLFSPEIFKSLVKGLDEKKENIKYIGDISDLGNEIGEIVSKLYPDMTNSEENEFLMGIRHGISVAKIKLEK